MRIALFGGSFDPPHLGHVLAATYAHAISGVDEVWVLPVANHPYQKELTPWAQRWQLCAAAFTGLSFVRLRDDELRNDDGYSFNLVTDLAREHPQHEWLLVGGTDTARDLVNWYRGAELAKLISIIAVPRRGFDDHPAALPAISSSLVRAHLATGKDVSDLVPKAVLELIRSNGWYATK